MTVSSNFILNQTNNLALQFYVVLGYELTEGAIKFYLSTDEQRKQCWDMAVIAQKKLSGIDPALYIPKADPIAELKARIQRAATDGKQSI
jgi:hypothetical protein